MSETKAYLGDGVYVDVERGMLVLTTENGIAVTNRIYIEPEVLSRLYEYVAQPFVDAQCSASAKRRAGD